MNNNNNRYLILGKELQELAKTIPLNWGRVQNNRTDSKINMFNCQSLDSLEEAISNLPESDKIYFRKRWFLWRCAQVDEYLFHKENFVSKNPNHKDQSWDINFNNTLNFDIKGTIVPSIFRKEFEVSKEFECKLINFYYQNQSKGVRFNIQNRLFIVHHSFENSNRNMYLRCYWDLKNQAYKEFIHRILEDKIDLIKYQSVFAKCIFLLENKNNSYGFKII